MCPLDEQQMLLTTKSSLQLMSSLSDRIIVQMVIFKLLQLLLAIIFDIWVLKIWFAWY